MKKNLARSRRHLKLSLKQRLVIKWKMSRIRPLILLPLCTYLVMFFTQPIFAVYAPTRDVETVEKKVDVVREVEVDRTFKTEKQQILAYIVEKFGDRSADAITIINKCENHAFKTDAMNHNVQQSGRRSWDIGIFQVNVDESNTEEIEKLKGWKYNVDRAYQKYHAAGDTFRPWTCAHVIGEKNYLGQ